MLGDSVGEHVVVVAADAEVTAALLPPLAGCGLGEPATVLGDCRARLERGRGDLDRQRRLVVVRAS